MNINVCFAKCLIHHTPDILLVCPGSKLGHNTAKLLVNPLRGYNIIEYFAVSN